MINAMVLTWFIVGIIGTVLRCFFYQRQLPAYVQPLAVLYSVVPFLIPFSWAVLGALAIVVPYGLHRYYSSNRMINLLAFFSIFISFSSSRPLVVFINSFRLTRSDVVQM